VQQMSSKKSSEKTPLEAVCGGVQVGEVAAKPYSLAEYHAAYCLFNYG
jgi:hypothetical protein